VGADGRDRTERAGGPSDLGIRRGGHGPGRTRGGLDECFGLGGEEKDASVDRDGVRVDRGVRGLLLGLDDPVTWSLRFDWVGD
jgi:hypothetical protein